MGKICFFDIDGTLLDSKKRIPQSTKDALYSLKKNGVYVAIATGRAPFMIKSLLEELAIDSYVSFNGQYVVFEGEVIYRNPLSREQLAKLESDSRQHSHSMVFMNDIAMKSNVRHDPFIEESLGTLHFPHPEQDQTYYKEQDIYQGLLFCEEHDTALYEGKYPDIHFIRWHPYSMDVVPLGGSKAKGIEQVIKRKGFKMEDVYAFGDALNDMEMIQAAGCGVVMGNGVQSLKQHADFITKSVDDDGIYYALKNFKLI